MSNSKLRLRNTDVENLADNLRGEVGEIIYTWVLWRILLAQSKSLQTDDLEKDMGNTHLTTVAVLAEKMSDEIVARLSELGQRKLFRLNFYFVHKKLGAFEVEIAEYERFIKSKRFHEKRNYDISHKAMPEKPHQDKLIYISYRDVVKGIVMALRLMKAIDLKVLGPCSKYLWKETRKRRYSPMLPVKVSYMLLPLIFPPMEDRKKIIVEEMRAGMNPWEPLNLKVNGQDVTILGCKKWAAIILGDRAIMLDESFLELTEINSPLLQVVPVNPTPSGEGLGQI